MSGITVSTVGVHEAHPHTTPSTCDQAGVDDKCEEWVATHQDQSERPSDVVVSPDGATIYVAGGLDTVAYDTNGNELWVAPFPSAPATANPSTAYSVAVSPDSSRVFVTGQYQFPDDPYYATASYDASTGAMLWLANAGLPGHSGAGTHIGVSPDGATVFVVGENNSACFQPTDPCTSRWGTFAYDAATGNQRWVTYADPDSGTPYDLTVSPDGSRIFVTGNIGDTVAYNASTGAQLWLAKAPGDGPGDALWSLAVSPNGSRLFATGQTCQDDGEVPCNRYATIAYDAATGALAWVARAPQDAEFAGSYPEAGSLAVSPTGDRVFVAGHALATDPRTGAQDFDGLALAYDAATGEQVWQVRYDAGSNEEWYDVVVAPNGRQVFVSGRAYQSSSLSSARDFATAAYDSSDGRRAWVARYNNSSTNDGISVPSGGLAVSPKGTSVVVAGTFSGTHSHIVPSGGLSSPAWGLVSYSTGTGTPWPSPWADGGSLVFGRSAHTATLLETGRILVAGGCADAGNDEPCALHTATAELYDPLTESSSPVKAPLSVPRSGHTATLLADGRVLLAGGCAVPTDLMDCPATRTAEVFDPATGIFTPTSPMADGRLFHTSTRLHDGRVLVAGGRDDTNILWSAELFDPVTAAFSPAGRLEVGRERHTASLLPLPQGRVLFAGGIGRSGSPLGSAEIYDPLVGFETTGTLSQARAEHTATILGDGSVWLAGGVTDGAQTATATAERYDPAAGAFVRSTSLTRPRTTHTANLLDDGRVLVAGGRGLQPTGGAELFDPVAGTSTRSGGMTVRRSGSAFNPHGHTGTLLPDGRVAVSGGTDSTTIELYTAPPPPLRGADLSVTIADAPDPVRMGQQLRYTVHAANAGPLSASNVAVEMGLPSGTRYVSASSSQGTCSLSEGTVFCFLGSLAIGAGADVTIVVKPITAGTLTATTAVSGTEQDPRPMDNRATAVTTVTRRSPLPLN